jgi:hypothetical protein
MVAAAGDDDREEDKPPAFPAVAGNGWIPGFHAQLRP